METPSPPRPKRGYLGPGIIALVVLVVLALVINYAALSHPAPRAISGADAATLIAQGLQSEQNTSQPPSVTFPAEPVRAGLTFRCELRHADGTSSVIVVTEVNGSGKLSFRLANSG